MTDKQQLRLQWTDNARVWAEEFCGTFSIYTEDGVVEDKVDLMTVWFANAIETAKYLAAKELED